MAKYRHSEFEGRKKERREKAEQDKKRKAEWHELKVDKLEESIRKKQLEASILSFCMGAFLWVIFPFIFLKGCYDADMGKKEARGQVQQEANNYNTARKTSKPRVVLTEKERRKLERQRLKKARTDPSSPLFGRHFYEGKDNLGFEKYTLYPGGEILRVPLPSHKNGLRLWLYDVSAPYVEIRYLAIYDKLWVPKIALDEYGWIPIFDGEEYYIKGPIYPQELNFRIPKKRVIDGEYFIGKPGTVRYVSFSNTREYSSFVERTGIYPPQPNKKEKLSLLKPVWSWKDTKKIPKDDPVAIQIAENEKENEEPKKKRNWSLFNVKVNINTANKRSDSSARDEDAGDLDYRFGRDTDYRFKE